MIDSYIRWYNAKRVKISLGSQPHRVPRESWACGINQSKYLSALLASDLTEQVILAWLHISDWNTQQEASATALMKNLPMTTFAASFKREIARVARKELRDEISALRRGSFTYRSEIAELKRKIKALESQVKALSRTAPTVAPKTVSKADLTLARAKPGRKVTLGPAEFSALRQRLGFTQAQMAQLVGASALSIYKWESGQVIPRAAQLEKIMSVRKIGKREAVARLQAE